MPTGSNITVNQKQIIKSFVVHNQMKIAWNNGSGAIYQLKWDPSVLYKE